MKIKRKIIPLLVIIVFFVSTSTAFAYQLSATTNENLKIEINNAPFTAQESDQTIRQPLLYNDRTYLPVRPILEALDIYIDYDSGSQTIVIKDENALLSRANLVLHCLKYHNTAQFSTLIHPTKGVTFSPYAYIEDYHVNLRQSDFINFTDDTQYTWDSHPSGDPVVLGFSDFFDYYIYTKDFIYASRIGNNTVIQRSTANINAADYFPGASFIEYNFPSTKVDVDGVDWSGDWQSLRLYFEEYAGHWFLVAITHDGPA